MIRSRGSIWCAIAVVAAGGAIVATSGSAAEPAAPAGPAGPGYRVIKKIAPGGEGGWDYLTLDPVSRRLYIARSDRVMLFDVDKGAVIGEISNTPGVHGIALARKLGRGYTSNGGDSTVSVFDLKTLKQRTRIKVGTRPDGILHDPDSAQLFTFNAASADATVIDPALETVTGTMPLGGKPESAVADGKGHIFVNIEDKNEVLEFDSRKLAVLHHWPLAPGVEPAGLAMDLVRRRLFCTCRNQKMVVLDADNGRVLATLPIGKRTDACAFDPSTGLVFSSNGDGTLTVVRTDARDHYSVAETVTTQMGARTMALDPTTHNLFLVTAVSRPGEKHGYEPGTFVVIVVAKPTKPAQPPAHAAPTLPRPR
jgi:YVTN family beta-propeller protein